MEADEPPRRPAQRWMALIVGMFRIDGHQDDGRLKTRSEWHSRLAAAPAPPASRLGEHAGALCPRRTIGSQYLVGMAQVEGEMGSRLVARIGHRFEAAQDNLLQPGRYLRLHAARRP